MMVNSLSETRVFLVRHGERVDHATPEWAAHASRPHDAPITEDGHIQGLKAGEYIRSRVEACGGVGDGGLHVRTSPLVRCVQTAGQIVVGLGANTHPLQVDDVLCEEEAFLRPRMMGTHRDSAPVYFDPNGVVATCPSGAPRGVCQPVLLSPGDLVTIYRHVDLSYRTLHPVTYDLKTGVELDGLTGQPRSASKRAQQIVQSMHSKGSLVPPGGTVVLVTHGAFARRIGMEMLGESQWGNFGYAEVAELVCENLLSCVDTMAGSTGAWKFVGRFAPAGDAGRFRNV